MLTHMGQRERFGQIVRTWRRSQKPIWTQDFVKSRGGPSDTTQTRVERAEGPEPNLDTFNKYDIAFEWEPGTAARIYAGADPPPLDSEEPRRTTEPAQELPPVLSAGIGSVTIDMNLFTSLVRTYSEVWWAVESSGDGERSVEALELVLKQLKLILEQQKAALEKVTRVWLTEMLERHAGPNTPVPAYLEVGHSEQLNKPVSPDDPDAEDKLYLRWLAHRYTGDLSEEMRTAFLRRYQRKISELTSRPTN